jgi:DNA helicase IV
MGCQVKLKPLVRLRRKIEALEFDVVVIVDPERIRAHNPADLYVLMTSATQRLGLLHVGRRALWPNDRGLEY